VRVAVSEKFISPSIADNLKNELVVENGNAAYGQASQLRLEPEMAKTLAALVLGCAALALGSAEASAPITLARVANRLLYPRIRELW
jgi:hypothetical protein